MSRQIVPRRVSGVHRRAGQPLEDETTVVASALFDQYCAANTFAAITSTFQQMCDVLELMPSDHQTFYQSLKERLTSWKAQSLWAKLDKRAQQREYKKGRQCFNTRCLIIGGGPCGLRVAIEIALLGGKAVVVEKRDRFSRNNVLHLWPFLIHDLKALGAKKFFGKFCTGAVDHISIRTLQCILLKVALLLGVEIHAGVSFDELAEPPPDQGNEKIGWRAIVTPRDHPLSEYEFDVLVGADGKRNTLKGFKRKEFRGKLAIAITANFINRNTNAEACVEEISGVAFIFNQKFFKDLNEKTGIDLENIVYYKDETHYFVMTAKKHSLLHKGVLINDYMDTARLLSQNNVNQQALLSYACEAADVSTRQQLPHLDYAHNHYGQPDVAMFDFTSIYAAEHATRVIERNGYKLLMGLCGDSLIEPFWPTGSGCARGFLGALDLAATIKNWASARYTPLEVMAQRESVYQLLSQTTPENLSKNFGQYTMDPQTRYPNVNLNHFKPAQVVHQYDCTEAEFLDEIVQISDQKSKKYEWIRDSLYLQKWFGRQLESYGTIVKITDLEASWRNGLALCALIHKYRPELIGDIYKLDPNEVANNNQLAFDVAEKELGITPVMTGVDMAACEVPDKLTLVSYLSQFYEFFRKESIPTRPPVKIAKSPAQLPLPPRRIPQARSPAQRQTFLTRVNNRMRARKSAGADQLSSDLGLLYRQYQAWSSSEDILDRYAIPEEEQKENAERHLTQGHIRKRGHAEEDPDNIVLQGYSRFEGRHVNEPATKLTRQGDTARLSATPRTRNKVTQLARGLAHKLRGDPTVPQEKKKPLIIKQQIPSRSAVMGKAPPSADVCYFCQKRVYVVERHSAEGVFFHRGCLKCDFCSTNLRIGQYGFKRGDNGQAKFYCTQHIGLERPMRRSRKRSYDDKELRAQLAAVEDSDEDLPYGETVVVDEPHSMNEVKAAARGSVDLADERLDLCTERLDLSPERIVMSAVELAFKPESLDVLKATNGAVGGPLDKTPERIEYYTESEVEESELEQTQHNLSGSLLDIGVRGSASDSDEEILLTNQQLLTILGGSSSDELEWSDDAELSGAEGEWAQFATAYNKLNRLHKERRAARRAARLKQRTAGSGSDTETPGSSDDWESESETEKESEGEESDEDRFRSVRQDDGPPPVMPAQAREFSDEYEEEPRSPRSPLGQQLSPIDYEDKHPSPAATSILKNRLSFFSAVSEPVRIDPFSFLGLSPAPNIAQGEKQLEQESEQEPEQVPELKEAEAEKAEEELAEKVYKEGDEEEEEEETESSLSETDTMTEGSESEEDKMGVVKKVHHPIPTISIEEVDMVELRSDDNEVGELPLDNDARVVCVTPQYEDSIRQDDGPPATEPEYRDFSDEFEEDECADLQQQPAGEADVTTPAQGSEESVQREATAVEIAEQEISVPSPVRITTERVPEVEAEQFEEAESDTPAQAEQVHEDSQGDEAARTELVPQVAGSDGEVSVMRNDEALRKELDLMELEVEAMKRSVGDRIAELAKVTALEETEMPPPVEEEPLVGDPGMVLLTAQALENVPPVVEENLETFATSDIVPSDGQQVASEPLAVFVKDVCITESTTDSAIDSLIEMDVCATEPTIESATDFNILVGPCATEPTTESTADFTILAGVCTTESTTNPTSDSLILTDVCPTDSTTDSSILTGVCTSESTTDESVPSLTDVLSSVSDVARSEDLSATCPSFEAQFKELSAAIDESQNVGVMHVAEETNLMSETDSNSLVSADTIGSESRSNGSSAKRPTDLLTDSSDLSALKLKTALEKEMRRQNKIATKNSVHRTSSSELESFENIEALLKHRGEDQGTDIEADRLSSPLDEDTPKAELQMKAAPVAAMSSVVPSEDDLGPLSSVGPSERPSEDDLAAQGMAPIASIQEMFADMESTLDDLTPVLAEGANVESWVSAVLSESDHLETLQEPLTNAGTVAPGPAETGDNSSSSPTLTNNNSDEASDAALKSKQSIEDPRESSEISQTILEVKASTSLKPVSKEEVAVVGNAEKEDFLPTSVSADSLLPKHRPRPLRKDISLPSGNQTLNLKEQMLLERQQARKKEEKLKAKQATKKEPKVSVNRKEETKRKTPTMSLKESESRLTKSLRESESKLRRQLSAPEPQIAKILEDKKHEENEKRKQPIFIKPPKKKSFDIPQDVPIAMAAAAAARARLTGRPISHDVKSKKQREEEVTKRLKEEHMKAKQAKKAEMERQDEARKKQREEDARRKRLQDEQRERDMEDARKKNEIELRRMREQKRTSKPVQIEKLDSWKQADAIKRIDTLLENLRGQPQTKGDTLKNLQKRQSEEIGILAQKLMSVEYRPGFENEMTPEKVASPSEKLEPTTEVILSIERGGGDAYPEKVYNIDDKFITSRDRRKRIRNLSNQSDSSITNVTNTTISTPSGSVRSISSVSEIFTANSIGISPGDTGSLDLLATTSESLGENISLDGLLDQDKDQLEETKNLIRPKSAGNVEELKQAVRPKSAQAALSVSIVDTSKADDSSMHTAESSLSESRSTNTTADESRYFTPNVSGLEVLDTSETSSNKCIQPADATSNTSSDRKSVDSLDTERSNSPLSPGKVTDAKRKFFCELPQPVCIDPKKIFRDLRSPQGKGKTLKDSLDKKEKRTHERDDTVAKGKEWKSMDAGMSRKAGGLDLRKDWQSMDSSTTPLSPTAGVPKTNLVNGEAEANVFYTPVSIMKTKADEPPQHRPHTEPTAKKRMLPPTKEEQESKPSEVEKGRREAEREKARQDARQRAKMLSDEELGIEEKNQKKPVITRSDSQPEATMYATKDMQPQPSASRTQPKPLSPQVQKVEGGRVPQHDRVGSDSSSRSTNSHPSEASTFGSSDRHRAAFSDGISDHSENSPAQSRKLINEKTKSLDRDKTKRRTLDTPTLDEAKDKGSGKKEKRRSFLAMLLPKKDKSKDKSTNVKPPKEDKKLKKTPEAKKSVLRLRTKLKMPKAAEKEKEMNRSSTYADEFNPFFEDAYGMEEKQKLKEKLDHVAPAATLTPTASRVAPKATVEEFDTESEFGDDRISVHSFRAQMLTEEDRAKAVKKQQKAAVRRQREQELKRLRMAQEIQRQLEEVEIKQRQVEMRGIALERALRGEGPDASRNEADLMQEWFNVVHEKNMLVRYESELMVHARELELEDRHSRLEQQLRDRMSISETEMTPAQKEEEQRILEELLEVVEQRDSLVALLEEDRLRLREEEKKRKTEILNR